MKTHCRCSCLIVAGSLLFSLAARAQLTEYVWQSNDGDPEQLAGSIILDSPANADGTTADIVSMSVTSFITENFGPPVWAVNLANLKANSALDMAWDGSTITSMTLQSSVYFEDSDTHLLSLYAAPGELVVQIPEAPGNDLDGSWVRNPNFDIPDTSATLPLLGLSLCALCASARKFRSA